MKTIAIDVDDVLAANAEAFVKFSNERWGTNLTVDDYDEHWAKVWQVDNEEVGKRSAVWHTDEVIGQHRPYTEALPVLKELKKRYKLIVATSRRLEVMKETEAWINKHFMDVFDEIHYSGVWDTITDHSIHMTKAELCKQIGADYLVDDQLKHCLGAHEAGVKAVLFGNYAWNQGKLPKGVTRVSDWRGVLEHFSGLK